MTIEYDKIRCIWRCSDIVQGTYIRLVYIGYTKTEAISAFCRYVSERFPDAEDSLEYQMEAKRGMI